MGLDFIRNKSAKYSQMRDSSSSLSAGSNLLERLNPDRIRELFDVKLRDATLPLAAGYRVLVRLDSDDKATVHQNGLLIGDLDPAMAKEISRRLKENGKSSGMFEALIQEVQDVSGLFKVAAVEPKDIKINECGPKM